MTLRLTLLLALAFVLSCLLIGTGQKSLPIQSLTSSVDTHFAYDSKQLARGLSSIIEYSGKDPIRTIIIPHHSIASPLIATGIASLSLSKPKTVVILSPNHSEEGKCSIITTYQSWLAPSGTVYGETNGINSLLQLNEVCVDDRAIGKEHGIASLIPYINILYPKAKVIPLSLKYSQTDLSLNNLAEVLAKLPADTVYIASVDFAHDQSPATSKQNDNKTLSLIKESNQSQILGLNSDYVDSPSSIVTILKLNKLLSFNNLTLTLRDDSNSYLDEPETKVTSYQVLGFSTGSQKPSITIVAGGDVMLGRSVNTRSIKYNDFTWAFKNIAELFNSADIAMVNLEGPLVKNCPQTDSGMVFCGDERNINGLTFAGIDIVSLANNHIYNHGEDGYQNTLTLLNQSGVAAVGQEIVYKKINQTTIAFIGLNALEKLDQNKVKAEITEAKSKSDFLIVTIHWGNEYQAKPSPYQVELGHFLIDAGVDLIIGHHPHWVQSKELYKNKTIYYSLGNLIFDQMWSPETQKGLVLKITIENNKIANIEEIPIKIYDYGQPKVASTN